MTPTILALFVLVPSLFATGTRMITVFLLCCLFGAAAAIEVTALGGAPITPAVLALPFLIWWAVKKVGVRGLLLQFRYPSAGAWLLYLSIWGVLSAFALPRYFAGETYVFNTSRAGVSLGPALVLLGPGSTNITQTCYLLGNLAAFVALVSLLQGDGKLKTFRNGVIALTSANAIAAVLGLVEEYAGVPLGMDLVRNAGYANFGTVEVAGLIRIVGTFSEASSFAGFTCPLFAFMAYLWRNGQCPLITGPLAVVSLALLALSTSSTGYGALLVYSAIILIYSLSKILNDKHRIRIGSAFAIIWIVMVSACIVLLAKPELLEQAAEFFEITVIQKLDSNSGMERATWNRQAWTAFLDSYGVGVGLGSARASSNVVVVLSNLGVIGAVLYLAFLTNVFRGVLFSDGGDGRTVAEAAAHGLLMVLIVGMFGQTNFDAGPAFIAFAAAAVAGAQRGDQLHTRYRAVAGSAPV